jgi:uncharacterized membrane protein YeaQ/YmgE (transglycosylase-associated protein family)
MIIIGLIAGALTRWIVPCRRDMSVLMTIILGILGSFVSGFLGYLLFHKDAQDGFTQPAGVLGSIVGAVVVVLLIWSRTARRRTAAR